MVIGYICVVKSAIILHVDATIRLHFRQTTCYDNNHNHVNNDNNDMINNGMFVMIYPQLTTKLLKILNQMHENENEKPLDVDKIIRSEPSSTIHSHITIWQKYMIIYFCVDNSDKREISYVQYRRQNYTKLCTSMTIW
ncbi:hypothetical protein RFI_04515 [Reticulomyxa filosa]|uniref:Uncharacterized protein n=1 Tax=Reticulomyxa filosa TaxID=46433 RepID=X6P398_RETFI|nr:hypothetical protein RFI_04515 [Reticulomyxa filosa]|eukprot:ETO32603.1 hypothetical protein RFI_04515 [Reticulomyxa filosa]